MKFISDIRIQIKYAECSGGLLFNTNLCFFFFFPIPFVKVCIFIYRIYIHKKCVLCVWFSDDIKFCYAIFLAKLNINAWLRYLAQWNTISFVHFWFSAENFLQLFFLTFKFLKFFNGSAWKRLLHLEMKEITEGKKLLSSVHILFLRH